MQILYKNSTFEVYDQEPNNLKILQKALEFLVRINIFIEYENKK